ncbi:MAG: SDR family oxidoreductase, partial [Acidimicrobiia bacterium]|nr:SDR family oxidoreductase [Acidimicrobiia bacterium]
MTTPANLDLRGKTALVTGASKGIGLAIADAYAAAGANVMLSSRKQDALDKAAATITGPGEVSTFAANAGDPDAAAACVAATVERLGSLDILVNNAATNTHLGPAIEIDLPRFDKNFQVNLRGAFVWTQEAWRKGMRERGGSVINVVSIGGLRHDSGIGIYNVTKAALIHLTKVLAAELAPGVRVNAIAPGLVKTDFARALWEPAEDLVSATMPLKRLGEPDDIAAAALFLASDLASWITGETLVVDGGALI